MQCGSEVKAMKQDKYIEWLKKIENENKDGQTEI